MPKPKITFTPSADHGYALLRDGVRILPSDMTDEEFALFTKKCRFDALALDRLTKFRDQTRENKAAFAAMVARQTAHIPRLTDDSRVSDVHEYLDWLAASPHRYDIDHEPETFPGSINAAYRQILQANHEIMWAVDDSLWMHYGKALFRAQEGR